MAIVVESTASNSTSSSSNLTITKPAGLQVGDLIVASLTGFSGSGTFTTLSGWTLINSVRCSEGEVNVQYKVADSGDVAASNFTFAAPVPTFNAGSLLRISGYNSIAPIEFSDENADNSAPNPLAFTTSDTPSDGSLMILAFLGTNGTISGAHTASNFLTTGLAATWTESHDVGIDLGINSTVGAAAYANVTTGAAVSAYGVQFSAKRTLAAGQFIVLAARTDASGTNTLVTTTSEVFAQAGTADCNTSNSLVETDTVGFTQGGKATAPTQWTNEAKPSTTWVNETK